MSAPAESVEETKLYLSVCFAGIPFITAYNVIASIYRGLGDSKSPMIYVSIACFINIILDCLFMGVFGMKAEGAAFATVLAQTFSVITAIFAWKKFKTGLTLKKSCFKPDSTIFKDLLKIGLPVSAQDGFIQISFLLITIIANSRGVNVAAAVGLVEKIISFLFLVPSAMLSSVSAIAAQNAGAGKDDRGRLVLWYGILICICFGAAVFTLCQFFAEPIVRLFVKNDSGVVHFGGQYLRSYTLDCMLACIHFCFSGYFCAYNKAFYSFIHNVVSVIFIRIPGTYLASVCWPENLYPMGLAAPAGSLLSNIICVILFVHLLHSRKKSDLLTTV